MHTFEYVISNDYDQQIQIQCQAMSFDHAWDIARAAAKAIGGFVVEVWGGNA